MLAQVYVKELKMRYVRAFGVLILLLLLISCGTDKNEETTTVPRASALQPTAAPADADCNKSKQVVKPDSIGNLAAFFCLLDPRSTISRHGDSFDIVSYVTMFDPCEHHVWVPAGWKLEGYTLEYPDGGETEPVGTSFGCAETDKPALYGPRQVNGFMGRGTFTYAPNETECPHDSILGWRVICVSWERVQLPIRPKRFWDGRSLHSRK